MNYVQHFPSGELTLDKSFSSHSEEKVLFVSLDTEYTRLDKNNNLCLSWQLAVYSAHTGLYATQIVYMDYETKERLNSNEVLSIAFELAGLSATDALGYEIVIICHSCGAELSMLSNRKNISQHLEFVYKSVVTYTPRPFPFLMDDGLIVKLKLRVCDTLLLLPVSHQSLDKATSLLADKYHKKSLSSAEKDDMLTLLLTDPKRFEEYAIHDAVITLMLFIKLQYLLNHINNSEDAHFTTIGGATVKIFKKYITQHFPEGTFSSQFNQKNSIYQKGLSLAQRAYLGGLNNSYVVGEVTGELILDIDFSSAYPTVMGLLPLAEFGTAPAPIRKSKKKFTLGRDHD